MCSSTSRGVHPPSFKPPLIVFHLGDNSVNTWSLSSTRDWEKGTIWLQWEGEKLNFNCWLAWLLCPSSGLHYQNVLGWETPKILLSTGISIRNIFFRKKKKNVVVYSNIHDNFISSNLTYKLKIGKSILT